jgi:hypothetical protein
MFRLWEETGETKGQTLARAVVDAGLVPCDHAQYWSVVERLAVLWRKDKEASLAFCKAALAGTKTEK